jgi:SAM-dependent methyltransferase
MGFAEQLMAKEKLHIAADYPDYVDYHGRRFKYVVGKCVELCPQQKTRVLDVGRSHLSALLLEHYDSVWTLGFPIDDAEGFAHPAGAVPGRKQYAGHIVFDLNDTQTIEVIPTDIRFNLIVFAEVIEHLHTAPELVLHALCNLLTDDGIIVCQTPNASALHKRITLLLGRNPYERLRIDARDPGHIREYTKRELIDAGRIAGLEPVAHEYAEYFGRHGSFPRKLAVRIHEYVARIFPSLSRGQTIVFRRREAIPASLAS